jgi:hypothetical protein
MSNISAGELLEQFVRNNSEAAFSTLVERHLALVHFVALRQLCAKRTKANSYQLKMKHLILLSIMTFVASVAVLTPANGGSPSHAPPQSEKELVERVREATDAKNGRAFLDLMYWNGVDGESKTVANQIWPAVFQCFGVSMIVTNVAVQPLPANFQKTTTRNGMTHDFNLPLAGVIAIQYETRPAQAQNNSQSRLKGGKQAADRLRRLTEKAEMATIFLFKSRIRPA